MGGPQAQKETRQQKEDEDFGQHPGLGLWHQHELSGDQGHSTANFLDKVETETAISDLYWAD